jgi:Flp pilus assembly protein TadG
LRLRPGLRDEGSISLEVALLVPGLLALLLLGVVAGRVTVAGTAVDSAAKAAARAATLARTPGEARERADTIARATLAQEGLHCTSITVVSDVTGFAAPVGTPAAVTVTVRCRVPLEDLSIPGSPNLTGKTLSSSFTSELDVFRARK